MAVANTSPSGIYTQPPATEPAVRGATGEREISLLALANFFLRWRRMIAIVAVVMSGLLVLSALTKPRVYISWASFMTQGAEESSGLAEAASLLGLRAAPRSSGGGSWGPGMYLEVIMTRTLLEPILFDTIVVAEEGNRRTALIDLLVSGDGRTEARIVAAVNKVRGWIVPETAPGIGGVKITVSSKWPSVSHALATRLVRAVNEFNLHTRQSQASVERRFVEEQARQAEIELGKAEDRMIAFLQRNRVIDAPQLRFEEDRLQREVNLRQQIYNGLLQSREQARSREVRDTPVITLLESPRVPIGPEPRNTIQFAILGAIFGAVLGTLLALVAQGFLNARHSQSEEAREFWRRVQEATPRLARRAST